VIWGFLGAIGLLFGCAGQTLDRHQFREAPKGNTLASTLLFAI
jgi:hypothetical protein